MKSLKIISSPKEFELLRKDWQKLVTLSDCNPLFLSWAWQYSWWESWGQELNLKLQIYCVYENFELVGLLPLYQETTQPRYSLKRKRLQFIGNHWQTTPTVRTEYLGPIVKDNSVNDFFADCLMENEDWGELIICDAVSVSNNSTEHFLNCFSKYDQCSISAQSQSTGYKIYTNDLLSGYKRKLGRNTRKKYFNDLDKAESLGIQEISLSKQPSKFIKLLNEFHQKRWGRPVFNDRAVSFHLSLIDRIQNSSCQVFLNALKDKEQIISISYNIEAGGNIFNLQSGFLEEYKNNLSLGKIMMGIDIKNAFNSSSSFAFDLLAGQGKNTDYKKNLGGDKIQFTTLAIVRKKRIDLNYKLIQKIKGVRAQITKIMTPSS